MGVVTVSLNDNAEQLLRKTAHLKYGDKKDALSKTIEEAVENYAKNKEEGIKQLFTYLDNPIHVEGKMYKHRSELYDRKIFG